MMLDLTEDDGAGQRFASPAAWCLLVALALALLVAWGYRVDNTSLRRELGEARQEAIAATCKAQETLVGKASLIGGKVYIRPDGKVPVTDGRCCCGSPPFPGEGWYCKQTWQAAVSAGGCDALACVSAVAEYIETQGEWDSFNFNVCVCGFILCTMEVTDGVRYDEEPPCECP